MKTSNPQQARKGSVIVLAMIVVIFVGAASASYMKMASTSYKMSEAAYHGNSMINLIELGAEMAIWSMNSEDWSGWTRDGDRAYIYFNGIGMDRGERGYVHVLVENIGNRPLLTVESRIRDRSSGTHWKQTQIELRRRSMFANGLSAKDRIVFKGGNAETDSYDSRNGVYHSTFNRNDKGSVSSISIEQDAVDIGNAKIYGPVATGGGMPDVGPQGEIRNAATPGSVSVDTDIISMDYYAEFPDADTPTLSSPFTEIVGLTSYTGGGGGGALFAGELLVLSSVSGSDGGGADGGTIGTETGSGSGTIYTIGATGTEAAPEEYLVDGFRLQSQDTLLVVGPTILVVDGDTQIDGQIIIETTGTLEFYIEDKLQITGIGITNKTSDPGAMLIVGTEKSGETQEIHYGGNGALSAAIYAPNARLELKGAGTGGVFYGAAVAKSIKITGDYDFHYDEALADFSKENNYHLNGWREVVWAEDRLAFDDFILTQYYPDTVAGTTTYKQTTTSYY